MHKILRGYESKEVNKTPFAANLKKQSKEAFSTKSLVVYNPATKQITVRRYSFDNNGGGYQGL